MPVSVELSEAGDLIRIETEWRYKELCKSIPGASWNAKEQSRRVPLSWASCSALRSVFKADLQIGPRLAEWATNELASRVTPANELRDLEDYAGDEDLFPHQRAGVAIFTNNECASLCTSPALFKGSICLSYRTMRPKIR